MENAFLDALRPRRGSARSTRSVKDEYFPRGAWERGEPVPTRRIDRLVSRDFRDPPARLPTGAASAAGSAPVRRSRSRPTSCRRSIRRGHPGLWDHFVHFNGALGEILPETMGSGVSSLTTTAMATLTCSSSTRAPWPGHENKPPRPPRPFIATTARGIFRTSPRKRGWTRASTARGLPWGTMTTTATSTFTSRRFNGGHLFKNDGKGHFQDVTAAANARGAKRLALGRDVS